MLVELKAVEQRYGAVIDVLDGMSVTEVAQRNRVSRQSVHTWLRRYANGGMAALADKSSKPESCPHQMAPLTEARVISLRREHPDGDRDRSAPGSPTRDSRRCRVSRRSIGPSCATTSSSPPNASAHARTTSAGNAAVPWSCGRWTSSGASISSTAPRSRSSPGSTITHGSASAPAWWPGRRPGRCAKHCSGPCAPMACPTRY